MGHIRQKLLNILAIIFLIAFLSVVISENCCALNNYDVSFSGEPTYDLIQTLTRNDKIIGKSYKIHIPLYNSGPDNTEEITVNISDEEGFDLFQNVIIGPDETVVVTFNWSTILIRNQLIKVNYYPADIFKDRFDYNSGKTSFTIKVVEDEITGTSTPGFESVLVISAIIVFMLLWKKRNIN